MFSKVLTVSQLNSYIGGLIASDGNLQGLLVEGELSNVNINSKSGHMYFSVKDKNSVIRAVMFSWSVRNLKFRPADGMKVIIRAQVTVYEPSGQYQLRVEDMQPDGVGALAMQLEQLKKKLNAEGLFDDSHKKPLPDFPRTVGVITSPTGAALRDICDILGRRFPCAEVVLAPVLVQGEEAPAQLIRAVNMFSVNNAADVIIIGRGGGSMEDLWAFNDEGLARAIYECRIPVISAVGHETDVTICDFVSDLRAPTPSAAAELAVPDRVDLYANIVSVYREGTSALYGKLNLYQNDTERLYRLTEAHSPALKTDKYTELVTSYAARAHNTANARFDGVLAQSRELFSKLEALNPMAVLNRGFAYVSKEGKNVASAKDVKSGDIVDIRLRDGSLKAEIK